MTWPLRNPVDLLVPVEQTGTEGELMANIATTAAAAMLGELDGESTKLKTIATNSGGRARAVQVCTRAIEHDPGRCAEAIRCRLVDSAAEIYLDRAARPAVGASAPVQPRWSRQPLTAAGCTARIFASAGLSSGAVATQVVRESDADLIRQDLSPEECTGRLLSETQDRAARLDLSVLEQTAIRMIETSIADIRSESERRMTAGDPAGGLATVETAATAYSNLRSESTNYSESRARARDEHYARANETIGRGANAGPGDRRPTSLLGRLVRWLLAQLRSDDGYENSLTIQQVREEIAQILLSAVEADLEARVAAELQVQCEAAVSRLNLLAADLRRTFIAPIETLRRRAALAGARAAADAREAGRRLNGVYTPNEPTVLDALFGHVRPADDALLATLVLNPLRAAGAASGHVADDELLDLSAGAAEEVCSSLRRQSLDDVLTLLGDTALGQLAEALVSPRLPLEFRTGHPEPRISLRVAVPGGTASRLGRAVRARRTGATVVVSHDPLGALAVLHSEPFRVTQLEAYARWKGHFDDALDRGEAARLVTDRRLLSADDGLLSDDALDGLVVAGVVAGRIAPSQEPPAHRVAGGTWYLIPEGERRRPSQVQRGSLDAIFGREDGGGGRLGRNLVSIRAVLRAKPGLRKEIEKRYREFVAAQGRPRMIELLQQLDHTDRLPSTELASAVRRLMGGLQTDRGMPPGDIAAGSVSAVPLRQVRTASARGATAAADGEPRRG